MSKKVRVTTELIAKAERVFSEVKHATIQTGEGLTRSELRALERHDKVERITNFGRQKYSNSASTLSYLWRLKK